MVQQHDVVGRVENAPKPLELAQVLRHAEVGGPLKRVESSEAVQHLQQYIEEFLGVLSKTIRGHYTAF